MRGPTRDEQLKTPPPELRMSSKTAQAYLDVRQKILSGVYPAGEIVVPKQIEADYLINNTSTQVLLMRLANEGLVQVLPIKARTWPNNASLNTYRVADLSQAHIQVARRNTPLLPSSREGSEATETETLLLKIQYADEEIAALLGLKTGERVVFFRERQRDTQQVVFAMSDSYLPFWFAEMLPELEQRQHDLFALLRQQGRHPATYTETVEVMQARSVERVLFELSPDDPAPLLKLQRQTCDKDQTPLVVQFLTIKPEYYRLAYQGVVQEGEPY